VDLDADQDVPDFLGEVSVQKAIGNDDDVKSALTDQRERMKNFLEKKRKGKRVTWKPKKRHRKSSFQGIADLHGMVRSFLTKGLMHFHDPLKELPARKRPRLSLAPDMGSDNVCLASFLSYHEPAKLNIDWTWDFMHGCHDDLLNGLKEAGEYERVVLSLLRLNIPVSPWNEGTRFKQNLQALDEILATSGPETCESFQAFSMEMLREPAGAQFIDEPNPEEALWKYLAENHPCMNRGTKVILGRYGEVLHKLGEDVKHFAQRKFLYLQTCVELDMVGSQKFADLIPTASAEYTKATDSKRDTPEEKQLRKASANQMVVGLMDMMAPDACVRDKLVVIATEVWLKDWLGPSSARLRGVTESLPWIREQLDGAYLKTCLRTFRCLSSEPKLHFCEFVLPTVDQMGNLISEEVEDIEDLHAQKLAHCTLGVNYCRLKRAMWMLNGWNARSCYFTTNSLRGRNEVKLMQSDKANFDILAERMDDIDGKCQPRHGSP
jgi:hypothetical protein